MNLTLAETILGGVAVAFFSVAIGLIIGSLNKMSKEDCEEKQHACSRIICGDISHVKEDVTNMKDDLKDVKHDVKLILKRGIFAS